MDWVDDDRKLISAAIVVGMLALIAVGLLLFVGNSDLPESTGVTPPPTVTPAPDSTSPIGSSPDVDAIRRTLVDQYGQAMWFEVVDDVYFFNEILVVNTTLLQEESQTAAFVCDMVSGVMLDHGITPVVSIRDANERTIVLRTAADASC